MTRWPAASTPPTSATPTWPCWPRSPARPRAAACRTATRPRRRPRRCAPIRRRCCGCWNIPACSGRCSARPRPTADGRFRHLPFWCSRCWCSGPPAELASMDYVPERTGPRQRVPLFDAPALREFLGAPARRLFLAELLASFTRVASGRYRVTAGGRTRTRRFSELDPVRLAGLLEEVARRRAARRIPQARRRDAVPDRGVPWLRGRPRTRAGGRCPAAARGRRCPPPSKTGWPARRVSSCGSTSAPAGTEPPVTWPRSARRGSRWSATWPTGSGRRGGCSTTSPTGTCSLPATPGSPSPHKAVPEAYRRGPGPGGTVVSTWVT